MAVQRLPCRVASRKRSCGQRQPSRSQPVAPSNHARHVSNMPRPSSMSDRIRDRGREIEHAIGVTLDASPPVLCCRPCLALEIHYSIGVQDTTVTTAPVSTSLSRASTMFQKASRTG